MVRILNPKNMSTTYIGNIIAILSLILPKFGITIGSDELTTTASTIGGIIGGFIVFYGRYKAGGVSLLGFREEV